MRGLRRRRLAAPLAAFLASILFGSGCAVTHSTAWKHDPERIPHELSRPHRTEGDFVIFLNDGSAFRGKVLSVDEEQIRFLDANAPAGSEALVIPLRNVVRIEATRTSALLTFAGIVVFGCGLFFIGLLIAFANMDGWS